MMQGLGFRGLGYRIKSTNGGVIIANDAGFRVSGFRGYMIKSTNGGVIRANDLGLEDFCVSGF